MRRGTVPIALALTLSFSWPRVPRKARLSISGRNWCRRCTSFPRHVSRQISKSFRFFEAPAASIKSSWSRLYSRASISTLGQASTRKAQLPCDRIRRRIMLESRSGSRWNVALRPDMSTSFRCVIDNSARECILASVLGRRVLQNVFLRSDVATMSQVLRASH